MSRVIFHLVTASVDVLLHVSQQDITEMQGAHELANAGHVSTGRTRTHDELLLETSRTKHVQFLCQCARHARRNVLYQHTITTRLQGSHSHIQVPRLAHLPDGTVCGALKQFRPNSTFDSKWKLNVDDPDASTSP